MSIRDKIIDESHSAGSVNRRSGNVVGRYKFNEVTLRRARLALGWVTVFGQANHLSVSPSHPG